MISCLDRLVINTNINLLHWAFNLSLDPIIISSVLATFKLNLLALSQQVLLLSSEVTSSLRSATVFADKVILVSSTNIFGAASHRQWGRSLIYITKAGDPGCSPAVPATSISVSSWQHVTVVAVNMSAWIDDKVQMEVIKWNTESKSLWKLETIREARDLKTRRLKASLLRPTKWRLTIWNLMQETKALLNKHNDVVECLEKMGKWKEIQRLTGGVRTWRSR